MVATTYTNPADMVSSGLQNYDTTTGTITGRTITAGAGIAVTNGSGTAGNPVVASQSISTPGVSNLGIQYAAGTFTVLSASGASLGASNPAYVTLPSKGTPGRLVTIAVTANQTFTDGAAGTIDNQRFELVTGVNWAQDIPFYLYAVESDDEASVNFMISRNPAATTSPAATSIGKTGAVVNVGRRDFFSLGNVTVADYESNPCICIGAFRMQFVGATDSWTVQTLSVADGIGRFHENTAFVMPSGVNGSAAGTYFQNTGGTVPQFTYSAVYYWINRDGKVSVVFEHNLASTAGVGATDLDPTLPIAPLYGNDGYLGYFLDDSTSTHYIWHGTVNTNTLYLESLNISGGVGAWVVSTIQLNDSISFHTSYFGW